MTLPTAILKLADVEALLRASKLPRASEWTVVQSIKTHRRDPERRQQFILTAENDRAFLTIGKDLTELIRRTELFGRAYPNLGPNVLGTARSGDYSLLLQEHIDGVPLLVAFAHDSQRINAALTELESVFAAALTPSSVEGARTELKHLERDLVELDLWRDVDRTLLRDHVFPFL